MNNVSRYRSARPAAGHQKHKSGHTDNRHTDQHQNGPFVHRRQPHHVTAKAVSSLSGGCVCADVTVLRWPW